MLQQKVVDFTLKFESLEWLPGLVKASQGHVIKNWEANEHLLRQNYTWFDLVILEIPAAPELCPYLAPTGKSKDVG
jgi:hypothetical protein